jgi:uncharacterized membrane protein YbaN (DUF454 family)
MNSDVIFSTTGGLRYFRSCLSRNDEFYNRTLTKHKLFGPILELFEQEGSKDNLVTSACLDFFEHIRLVRPHVNSWTLSTGRVDAVL